MRISWFAALLSLVAAVATAQMVGPESSSGPFTAATTASVLAADRGGPVLAWIAPRADAEIRVFVGRLDGAGHFDTQELKPLDSTLHITFEGAAIANDGRDTVVVAKQGASAIVGWATDRPSSPQLMVLRYGLPALTAGDGKFYLATAADPHPAAYETAKSGEVDDVARTAAATVYTRTINTYTPVPCALPETWFCDAMFPGPLFHGAGGALTFTADSMSAPMAATSASEWNQTLIAWPRLDSGQSATIAASPSDWIILVRKGSDRDVAPLTAYRFAGTGAAAPSSMKEVTIAMLPVESAGPVPPPAGSRFWYARAAFDGQRYGVAWQERSPRGDHDIWFATIDADNKVSAPIRVAGSTAEERRPLIAATGSGSFFVAYDSGNGTSVRVAGRSVTLLASRRRAATR